MFNCRTYARDFFATMALYTVSVFASVWALKNTDIDGAAKIAVAMAPVIPTIMAAIVVLAHFRRLDEMQARVQLEGFASAAIVTGLLTFSFGFAENAGLPSLSLTWVLPIMLALWPFFAWLVKRRYS